MIGKLRKFASSKFAGILVGIIIIPFVFMGMGSVFNDGNTNNIAKINKTNISTQDFMNYLNQSGLSQQVLKDNIDKNILEELLSTLVSTTLLNLEIKDLDLVMPEDSIIQRIKKNKNFLDENGNFQRTIYEKFLLTNNTTAPLFEIRLKNNALQKQLFTYISGGTKSPKFLINKYNKEKNRKLDIEYINLNKFYKKKELFTDQEIQDFINENSTKLKQDYIDFSYINISPKNLTGLEEFNQTFFDKIDDIENKISKNIDFNTIVKELNIIPTIKKDYINLENKKTIENTIYNSRKNKIEILEVNGSYIFYQIDKQNSKLPNINDDKFKKQIKDLLYKKNKFEFNKSILNEINKKKFDQVSFEKLGKDNIKKFKLNSIKDDKKIEINSVEILYTLPIDTFTLIADDKDNVFIARVVNYTESNIAQDSSEFNVISIEANSENKNSVLKSYDLLLNSKYKVVVNEKTLDRVKNYFR
mgnify:CR=1 FL=1